MTSGIGERTTYTGEITKREHDLIGEICRKGKMVDLKVLRHSSREFDLHVEGKYLLPATKPQVMQVTHVESGKPNRTETVHLSGEPMEVNFGAWLPLWAIKELTKWWEPVIAMMTDYPGMLQGPDPDWSAVRDTNEDSLWEIFETITLS